MTCSCLLLLLLLLLNCLHSLRTRCSISTSRGHIRSMYLGRPAAFCLVHTLGSFFFFLSSFSCENGQIIMIKLSSPLTRPFFGGKISICCNSKLYAVKRQLSVFTNCNWRVTMFLVYLRYAFTHNFPKTHENLAKFWEKRRKGNIGGRRRMRLNMSCSQVQEKG